MKSLVVSPRRAKKTPGADEVENYLRDNPNFFQERESLLEEIRVPHACGEAVSLVEKQVDVLRATNRKLQRQLEAIVDIARENDALYLRLHRLTLALLDANSLEDALAGLQWALHECFQADVAVVRLLEPLFECPVADLFADDALKSSGAMIRLLASGKPDYGKVDPLLAGQLFGERVNEVASAALLPLQHAGLKGVLAIGSASADRFHAGMGATFLMQLSDIVAARLYSLLPECKG
ncbi:DUF484 family protein [Candidatus Methylospira mobilis]|uniref:DUF484 family protein n=1 Tax=Candidatus Methylospira mobilis TaxID=1808979 RepID=A0A5Q0BP11_9GAMM|nr:DUF484 family protein [Candidatus Methylospira mobilis]QFY43486.1 DUF484 family protein [Candidatus Methylospira mobilis]WNV03972.1 DUF484 family protein [Candidatus Methylospira mobilis]